MIKNLLSKFKNNIVLFAFLILGVLSFIMQGASSNKREEIQELPMEPKSVDTFIPKGYVLVPLEIANSESLNALVGENGGVVDLYLAKNAQQKNSLKVGSKLKILRAPLNPQQYAVLLPENEGSKILSYVGPFIAVVQNPQEKGTQLSSHHSRPIQIDYQN